MNIKDLLPQEKAERERQELKEMPDNELNILTQIFSLVYDHTIAVNLRITVHGLSPLRPFTKVKSGW